MQVTGAGANEEAYVTVAAVDVGILNLTRYEAPNPDGWYFGQRQLGLEIRDLYGRLIDGSLGATGKLRTGGDGAQMPMQGSPPTEKLVAFFSGPVKLDAQGKANVSFDIPQFNGTARVMAVAWSKTGVGHATSDVVIRDPVVVTASLPKFLAPGDKAVIAARHRQHRRPGRRLPAAGDEQSGRERRSAAERQQTINLTAGGKFDLTLPLTGEHPGDGVVSVKLSNAAGLSLEQTLNVPVRPATLPVTVRRPIRIGTEQQPEGGRRIAGRQHPAGGFGQPQRHPLGRLRHSGAADDARPLPLWLRRADDQPRPAAALSERTRQAVRHCRGRRGAEARAGGDLPRPVLPVLVRKLRPVEPRARAISGSMPMSRIS